jgi:hypothetical protein
MCLPMCLLLPMELQLEKDRTENPKIAKTGQSLLSVSHLRALVTLKETLSLRELRRTRAAIACFFRTILEYGLIPSGKVFLNSR